MPEVTVIVLGSAEGSTTSTIEVGVPSLAVVATVVVKIGAVPDIIVVVLNGVVGDTTSMTVARMPSTVVATVVV